MINVAAYVRSNNQSEELFDSQIRAIKDYAKKEDLNIVEIYIDSARNGTCNIRESFQQLIVDSKSQKFEQVIVYKLDRFSRNIYDFVHYKHALRENGVALKSVLENLDASPESIIIESILEGMAEYFSRLNLSEANYGHGSKCPFCQSEEVGGITND